MAVSIVCYVLMIRCTKRIVISPIELDRGNLLFGASTRSPEKDSEDNRYEDQFYSKLNNRCRFHLVLVFNVHLRGEVLRRCFALD